MKILATGDLHLGLSRFPNRIAEEERVLNNLILAAEHNRPDLTLLLGDSFDSRYPRAREMRLFAAKMRELADWSPVVVLDGNHDGKSTIGDVWTATLGWMDAVDMVNVDVYLEPGIHKPGSSGKAPFCVLVTIPYPHRRAYDVAGGSLDLQARHEAASRALDLLITELLAAGRKQADEIGVPLLFAAHGSVVGTTFGAERSLRLEDELLIPAHLLEVADLALLGHIHKQQTLGKGNQIWYPGAPMAVDFGEVGIPREFLLVEVEPKHGKIKVDSIPSGARPLIESDTPTPTVDVAGALVRVLLDQPASRALVTDIEKSYVAHGAEYVQVVAAAPARPVTESVALAASTDIEDAMRAYLQDRGLPEEPYLTAARSLVSSGD